MPESTPIKRVTLRDVGAVAGVSVSTVSLVLNNSPSIPIATKERVRRAINEIGYVYNRGAASLRSQRSMTIGLIATEVGNPFFAELTMSLEDVVADHGFTLLVGYSRDSLERQTAILDTFLERSVDGLVLLPARGTDTAAVTGRLRQFGVAFVLSSRSSEGGGNYVGVDNTRAGMLIGRHLRDRGIASAVFVGGERDVPSVDDRVRGAIEAFGDAVSFRFLPSEISPAGGAAAVARMLDLGHLPDAVIAFNDTVATGVYAEMISRGLKPGEDIAVAGFDDIPISAHLVPPLTSVATFPDRTGADCAEVLLHAIGRSSSDEPIRRLIRPEIRLRSSTMSWSGKAARSSS